MSQPQPTVALGAAGRRSIMKVILKPISHPSLGNISIADDLFAIGRNEEPFASKLGEAAASLSRRHARLFQEAGKVFLADLGSLNGTRINDRVLKNNVSPLVNNDRIKFGDAVEFQVEIRDHADQTADRAPPIRVTLVPVDPGSGLDTIAIENLPFLISRTEAGFEQYRERLPDAWRKLSRRHAVIALKGGRVNLEDLESSNGTYVSGVKLDERARQLADGDVVGFGDPRFSYIVRIDNPQQTQFAKTMIGSSRQAIAPTVAQQPVVVQQSQQQPAAVEQPARVSEPSGGPNRTRFVSSANSFINVFCADDELVEGEGAEKGAARTLEVQQLTPPATGLRKVQEMIGQLWRALGGSSDVDRRFVWGAAAVLGVIVVAGAITYLVGIDRDEIKGLLDEGHYSESASAANRYLERNPDDLEARAWAEDALIRTVVPVWMEHIDLGRFADAAQFLAAQREAHPFIPRGLQMIDTLAWAGRVEAHMADRGGASGPIVLFRHEEPIRTLVEEWGTDSFRRQQIMDQILTREPKFEHIHAKIFSSLTSLRSDNALYVKAIDDLKTNIQAALQNDRRRDIDKLIDEFTSSYPRITGIDALREDLARYDTLHQLVQQKELLQLVHSSRTTKFRTPIFAEYAEPWLAKQLPPAEVIAKHAEAAAAWRAGKHDQAIATLQSVKDAAWGEVAARQIARYQKVGADYDALLASKGSDGYWDRLLVVWSSLRPDQDDHLIRALEPDFLAHRDQVTPRLDQSLRRVRGYWDEYQRSGGIPGVVRVEERVTPRFSGQAKRLSSAYREISSGARTYQLLQITPPPEWQRLQQEVVDEVQRQRRWLQDLNIVLEPALLRAKLDLLPESLEQSLWVRSTSDQRKD
jgi:pSer/pThr/pTyr-binding forkhead associated (FHA) protein